MLAKNKKQKKDTSPYVHQSKKKDFQFACNPKIPWTDKQIDFIKLVQDKNTKIVFVTGPAGTSKTLLSVYTGLLCFLSKKISDLVYIRSVVESASQKMGFLPGELSDKFSPYLEPMMDKLEELVGPETTKLLVQNQIVSSRPINYLRGCQFSGKFIIADEAQNMNLHELTTLVTRIGEFSKVMVCGDESQSDIGDNPAFSKFISAFDNEEARAEGIFVFKFDEEDIVRSKILKFIVKTLKKLQKR